jgi:hypothetical protein
MVHVPVRGGGGVRTTIAIERTNLPPPRDRAACLLVSASALPVFPLGANPFFADKKCVCALVVSSVHHCGPGRAIEVAIKIKVPQRAIRTPKGRNLSLVVWWPSPSSGTDQARNLSGPEQ